MNHLYLETTMNHLETIQTWLTPPILFCIINLMILTIFLLKPKLKKLTEAQHLAQLIRVPLIFQRVLSNRSIHRSENQPVHHQPYNAPHQEPIHAHYAEEINSEPGRKETEPVNKETREPAHAEPGKISHVRSRSEMVRKKPVKKVLRKSFSEKISEETTTSQGDEAVDGKADDFISKFRKELKMQRVDSVNLEYSNMMSRGT